MMNIKEQFRKSLNIMNIIAIRERINKTPNIKKLIDIRKQITEIINNVEYIEKRKAVNTIANIEKIISDIMSVKEDVIGIVEILIIKIKEIISKIITLIFLSLCWYELEVVEAENLGVFGEIFEIEEDDLLQYITDKLSSMQQEGKLNMIREQIQEKIKYAATHPKSVEGISNSQYVIEHKFDPTIVVSRDLVSNTGKFFARAGEKFNPLDFEIMPPMLFIDGTNEQQINWALQKIQDEKIVESYRSKIVLVKGAPLELEEKLNRNVYFDQHGILVKKFDITHVPAIVFQKPPEKLLTVREEVLPK